MTHTIGSLATCVAIALIAGCGAPKGQDPREVVDNIEAYYGRTVTIRAQFKSGARCRQGDDGEWKTYCKDCQYCRGPLVVDLPGTSTAAADWPMILGGTHDYKDIRCKGPLNKVECHPFEPGQTYVVRGVVTRDAPPKLLVSKFWPISP